MNWIEVNTQDLLRLHYGCHGDLIAEISFWYLLSQESFKANMNSIRLKTKELLRFHFGYRGDLVIIATRHVPKAYCLRKTQYKI